MDKLTIVLDTTLEDKPLPEFITLHQQPYLDI